MRTSRWATLPNAVTFLRVALVPVILWLLTIDTVTAAWWAFGVFVFAALTDSVDGWVARRWQGVTAWGQLADPIADKLLVIGTLTSVAFVGDVAWWVVAVVSLREIAVTAMRVLLVRRHGLVLPANIWGKVKTVAQMIAVGALLLPWVPPGLAQRLIEVAVVLTIWSGLHYAVTVRQGRSRTAATDTNTTPPKGQS